MLIKTKRLKVVRGKYTLPVFLGAILIIHFISSYYILIRSRVLIYWDEFTRYGESFSFYNASVIEFLKQFFQLHQEWQYHPHLFSATAAIFWKFLSFFGLFSNSALRILLPNTFFLSILLISVYGIIKDLYEDEALALLGVVLLSFVPVVYLRYKVFMIDFPLMAMVALAVFTLIKSGKEQSLISSIACGVILWLGEMTKEIFILFILLVLLANLYCLLKERCFSRKRVILNFSVMLGIFTVFSLMVYLPFWSKAIPRYFAVPFFRGEWQFINFTYAHAFFWTYFHPFLLVLFLPLLVLGLLGSRSPLKAKVLLFFWIVPAFFFVSLAWNREARYLLPIVPAFVIASISGIRQLTRYKRTIIVLLVGVAILQWLVLTFNPGFMNYFSMIRRYEKKFVNKDRIWEKGVAGVTDELGGYQAVIDDIIKSTSSKSGVEERICSFISAPWASCELPRRLMFSDINTKVSVPFFWGDEHSFKSYQLQEKEKGLQEFRSADFVLLSVPLGKVWLGSIEQREYFMRSRELFLKEKDRWELYKIFRVNEEVIELYRRK